MVGHNLVLTVAFKNGRYWLYHCREFTYMDALQNPAEQAWIVLKEMNPAIFKEKLHKSYGYRLTGGDILKFGRVRFVVKKISSDMKYNPKPTLIMKEEDEGNEISSANLQSPGRLLFILNFNWFHIKNS